MIAAFQENNQIHVIFRVARKGLKVVATAYCAAEISAADGVHQLPARAFDGRPAYEGLPICNTCRQKACL